MLFSVCLIAPALSPSVSSLRVVIHGLSPWSMVCLRDACQVLTIGCPTLQNASKRS